MTQDDRDAEGEIRRLFEEWSNESANKDLDAVMRRIASNIVAYEHTAPLVYHGVDAVREVCKQGFEMAPGAFRWDVPELEVLVRDDIAVTWGLNRMSFAPPEGEPFEVWSRGTRILQRVDGKWLVIHQHLSLPQELVAPRELAND